MITEVILQHPMAQVSSYYPPDYDARIRTMLL
jgi:hypothetical protein